jgi:hypothetical protein
MGDGFAPDVDAAELGSVSGAPGTFSKQTTFQVSVDEWEDVDKAGCKADPDKAAEKHDGSSQTTADDENDPVGKLLRCLMNVCSPTILLTLTC